MTPCHRTKKLCLPQPLSCTFFTSVNVPLGFEFNFFLRVHKLIEIRAVPCMGLGSHLHLPFRGSAIIVL